MVDGKIKVHISPSVEKVFLQPWSNAVVVKLLGKQIGYRMLQSRIMKLWLGTCCSLIVEVANRYFQVKFFDNEDAINALTEGPWMILGYYLHVQFWTLDFDPWINKINKVVSGVRSLDLPVHLYDQRVLKVIGKALGHVLSIDFQIDSSTRSRYARMAIELDTIVLIQRKIWINNKDQLIIYENIPKVFDGCGSIGHLVASCPDAIMQPNFPEPSVGGNFDRSRNPPTNNIQKEKAVTTDGDGKNHGWKVPNKKSTYHKNNKYSMQEA